MNCNQNIGIKGEVTLRCYDKNHELKAELIQRNLIVNTGLTFFVNKILNIPNTGELGVIGIGNGVKEAELTDVDLTPDPITQENVVGFVHTTEYKLIRYKQTLEPNRLIVESVFTEGEYSDNEIAEVGLFTEDPPDAYGFRPLVARTVLEAGNRFVKADEDYLSVTWDITFG